MNRNQNGGERCAVISRGEEHGARWNFDNLHSGSSADSTLTPNIVCGKKKGIESKKKQGDMAGASTSAIVGSRSDGDLWRHTGIDMVNV